MQADGQTRKELLARIDELERQLAQVYIEKADLEILVETVTEHATDLENEVHQKHQEMLSYIQQVDKLTTAAVAVETNTFEPESLDDVAARSDELGCLARVFAQMVKTLKTREQELAVANERLEAILNAVPGAISWLDANGMYMGVNRHLAEQWQLAQDAFMGKEVGFLKGSDGFAEFIRHFIASPQDSASEIVKVEGRDAIHYYLIAAQKYQQGTATVSVGIDVTERKKTEEALHRSEEWFRTLIANVPGAIYRYQCDVDWTMEFISDAIAHISGYRASEFIRNQSRTFTSIIHPDDRESIETLVQQAVAARHPYNLEYRILHRDGSIRWVAERGRATFDRDGKLLYLDGAIFDITDRMQAEEALRLSEATNVALIKAIPDLLIRAKRDGTYLDITGRDRLTVYGVANFLPGSSVRDSLPPDLAEQRMYWIGKALETGKLQIYEQQIVVNNQPQDEEVRIVVTNDDEVLIMVRDITDRKRAEQALRIAEENYRSIYEHALEGIFQSTPSGQYINVNPAMARLYGYQSPEDLMASITEISTQVYVDPNCRDEFKRLMDERGQVKGFEYQVYRRDGSTIWVEENTRAVRDSHGKLLYYEGILQDITQRKQVEAELKRQLHELQIEIDQQKREQEVTKITQSDYFQNLQEEVGDLNLDEFWS